MEEACNDDLVSMQGMRESQSRLVYQYETAIKKSSYMTPSVAPNVWNEK